MYRSMLVIEAPPPPPPPLWSRPINFCLRETFKRLVFFLPTFTSMEDRRFEGQSLDNFCANQMEKGGKVRAARLGSFYAIKVLTWNERLLCILGIWPLQVRDSIFLSYFIYGCLMQFMGFLSLLDNLSDFDYFLTSLTENILFFMTLTKMFTCRINSRSIGRFLREIQRNVFDENYEDEEERSIFHHYNKLSYKFIATIVPMMTVVIISYFLNSALTSILLGNFFWRNTIILSMLFHIMRLKRISRKFK